VSSHEPDPDHAEVALLFAAASSKAAIERDTFLEEACAGNDKLREAVENLLSSKRNEASDETPSVLSTSDPTSVNLQRDTWIEFGDYLLKGEIARGGGWGSSIARNRFP